PLDEWPPESPPASRSRWRDGNFGRSGRDSVREEASRLSDRIGSPPCFPHRRRGSRRGRPHGPKPQEPGLDQPPHRRAAQSRPGTMRWRQAKSARTTRFGRCGLAGSRDTCDVHSGRRRARASWSSLSSRRAECLYSTLSATPVNGERAFASDGHLTSPVTVEVRDILNGMRTAPRLRTPVRGLTSTAESTEAPSVNLHPRQMRSRQRLVAKLGAAGMGEAY